jgi:hypothetical protein
MPDAKSLAEMHARLGAANAPLTNLGNSAFETEDPSGNRIRVEV